MNKKCKEIIEVESSQYEDRKFRVSITIYAGTEFSNYDRHGDPNPPSEPPEMNIDKIELIKDGRYRKLKDWWKDIDFMAHIESLAWKKLEGMIE